MKYTTFGWKRKALAVIAALVFLASAWHWGGQLAYARASETTTTAWALCESYINVRLWPSKKATAVGYLDPCDPVEVDGRTKDGFAHIVEPMDGWVHAGYLVFSEPTKSDEKYTVIAKKRVAARRWVDGPQMGQKPWLINGSEVQVLYWSEDWSLTNRGYVKSEFLEVDP